MAQPIKKRVSRSISVEIGVYERILSMSERLGVNVNAYLLEAVGQKLYKDESLLRIEESTAQATVGAMNNIIEALGPMFANISEDDVVEDKALVDEAVIDEVLVNEFGCILLY